MNFDTLISSNAVISDHEIKSKKRALELLANKLAEEATQANQADNNTSTDNGSQGSEQDSETVNALDIFQLLLEREKLGSTSMGHGVALPHARTDLTKNAVAVFLKLDNGIDFDSPDQQPTDLILALLVPKHYTDEHLKILAYLATLFSDEIFCDSIRNTSSNTEIHKQLINWQVTSQAS